MLSQKTTCRQFILQASLFNSRWEPFLLFFNRLNYTFAPRVLTNSRNWSCPFKTEQSRPCVIIFVAFFVLPPIFSSKKAQMANEGPCGIANLENAIYMSLKMGFLI